MSDWHFAQEEPTERLCKIEQYSMLKQQAGGDVEFPITVREYVNPPRPCYAVSGSSRQADQSEDRALYADGLGALASAGAGRVHERSSKVSL